MNLKLTGGDGTVAEKALVALHWSSADVESAELKSAVPPKTADAGGMVWDSFVVDGTEYIEVEFTLVSNETPTTISAVVVDSDETKLSTDNTKVPQP